MEVSTVFVGVIALSVAIMATVQLGIIMYGARLARRVDRLVSLIEQELRPALSRVNDASGDVTRFTSLAVAQIERVDQVSAELAERCDHLMTVGQERVVEPLRRSVALIHGLRVALTALRDAAHGPAPAPADPGERGADEQEALFIG